MEETINRYVIKDSTAWLSDDLLLIVHTDFGPSYFQLSPDGNWLLWECGNWGDGWPCPRAAHLDGSHYREWNRSRYEEGFFLDGRHYVQLTEWEPMLVVRDLQDATKDREYPEPRQAAAVLAQYALQQPLFLSLSDAEGNKPGGFAEIDGYATRDRIQKILALCNEGKNAPEPVQKHFVKLPEGASLSTGEVSSDQQSLYYHTDRADKPGLRLDTPFYPAVRQRPCEDRRAMGQSGRWTWSA